MLADRMASRRPLLLLGPIGALVGVSCLLFIPSIMPYWLLVANLVFTGAFLGTSVVIFGVVCDAVPPRYEATTIGLVNAAGCLMGAVLQVVPGILLGSGEWHPLSLLQQVLSLNVAVLAIAMGAVLFLRERVRAE
jgi:MFS family permease